MLWTLSILFFLSISSVHSHWTPTPLTNWTWQLTGQIDTTKNVLMYDIDLWDTPVETINALKRAGKKVICYFSAGSYEDWRSDKYLFPESVKGNPMEGWKGEWWLDIRRLDILGPIMNARLTMAKTKGCDGVEPDNVDAYTSDNKGGGFKLTYNDQIMYNTWLAREAHARDLSIGLKNDLDQIKDLVTHFDWAINEQCWEYNECDTYQPFTKANKAVFNCEYKTLRNCPKSIQYKLSSIQGPLALNGKDMKMCNLQGQLIDEEIEQVLVDRSERVKRAEKTKLSCPIIILGAGIGGCHSAYRLASILNKKICIFDRNNYIGGRTYDRDLNGNSPEAYSTSSISAQGAQRFYPGQAVIKELADELNISYSLYNYQRNLIKARGRYFTSINEMCLTSYVNLTCNNHSHEIDSLDQLWNELFKEYRQNPSSLYNYGNFNAFSRAILGDEATDFLRDAERFRTSFLNVNAHSTMETTFEEWNLTGGVYYPDQGMSQLAKRMIYQAKQLGNVQLYLNEEILYIDQMNSKEFVVETSRYNITGKQIIGAIDPLGWTNIQGSIARDIQLDEHFQSILPIKVVTIQCYWPRRWWEESSIFGTNIDRAWTRQNCISILEIISRRPIEIHQNLTRTVYDDGLCVEMWTDLIARSSEENLIEEILRGLRSLFIDVNIPSPTKVFTQIWPAAWHTQKANSRLSNKQITSWALKPLKRFQKNQFSLVGEAFLLDRSAWTEGAVKSSFISLTSQFNVKSKCIDNDVPSGGKFCPSNYI